MSLEDLSLPWPSSVPELKRLDELLRCGICYEFMATSVVTSCSHNYCSLCIRKYISYKTQCPACFMETTDQLLRPNRVIDEIVSVFPIMRDKIAKLLHPLKGGTIKTFLNGGTSSTSQEEDSSITSAQTPNRHDRDYSHVSPSRSVDRVMGKKIGNSTPGTGRSSPPSSSQAQSSLLATPKRLTHPSPSEGGRPFSSPSPSLPTPSSSRLSSSQLSIIRPSREELESKVTCPVCMVSIPEHNINVHLDDCLQRTEKEASPVKPVQIKRRPLPKLVYSLLSEKQLRQKVKEAKLSLQGDRQTLIKRHQKYTLLYNAELDEARPRSPEELARQVEREESQATQQIPSVFTYNRKTDPNVIEKEQKNYVNKHKNQFAQLLAEARKRQQEAKAKKVKENSNSETTKILKTGIENQSSETKKQSSLLELSQQSRSSGGEKSTTPSKLFSPKRSSQLSLSPSNKDFKNSSSTMSSSRGEISKSVTGIKKMWRNNLNPIPSDEIMIIDVDDNEDPVRVERENYGERQEKQLLCEEENTISPDIFGQSPAASDASCESRSILDDQQLSSDDEDPQPSDDVIPARQPMKLDEEEPEENVVSPCLSPELGRRMTRSCSKEKEQSVLLSCGVDLGDLGPDTQVFMESEVKDPDYQPSQLLTALDETEEFAMPKKRPCRSRGRQRKRQENQENASEGIQQQLPRTRSKRVCR